MLTHLQNIRYNLDAYQKQVADVTAAMSRMAAAFAHATPVTPSQPQAPRAIDVYEDTQVWPVLQRCDTSQLVQLAVMCGLHTHPYVTLDHRQQRKLVKHVLRLVRRDGRKLPPTYAHLPSIPLVASDPYATSSHHQQQSLTSQRTPQLAIQMRDVRTMGMLDLLGLCSYETMGVDYSEYLVERQRMGRREMAHGVAAGKHDITSALHA